MGEWPRVSAVVPCFNEASRLVMTLTTLTATLDDIVPDSWEIVVVDDSSTDETQAIANRWAESDDRVRVELPGSGKGKGAAVRAGLLVARGDFVFVTDADLAGDPAQLAVLLERIGGAAAAVGTRVHDGAVVDPPRPLRRRLPAAVFRGFARVVGGVEVSDPQCGFKLFRRGVVGPHAAALVTDGFAYEVELLVRLQRAGAAVVEVPIRWSEGADSNIHVVGDGLRMVGEVIAARRAVRRSVGQLGPPPFDGHDAPRPVLSVVMPVYNEAPVIEMVVKDVRHLVLDVGERDGREAELLIVDDRGTDGSSAIITALADDDPRVHVLVNPQNAGHGPSVLRGLDAARGEWLLQLDSDGQLDLGDFEAIWARRGDADLVVGARSGRQDPRHRLLLTKVVNALVSLIVRRRVRDANVGFKLISADLYRHLRAAISPHTFAPSLLFVIGAKRAGARMVVVPITHRARPAGASSLRLWRLARGVATATRQTLRYAVARVPVFRR